MPKEDLMPQADRIADVLAGRTSAGGRVTVQGWIRTRRDSKAGLSFLHLHDGSCFDALQVVAPATLGNYQDEVLRLTAGCAVTATGTLVPSQGQGQTVELLAESVVVVGWVDDPETYPITPKRHTFEYLREVAHLRVRTNTFGAVARVRHCLAMAIHRYFDEHGFTWVHTPILTASDAEGAGELFRVSTLDLANLPRTPEGGIDYSQDFFGKPAFLTVSGQLNIESYCLALTNVYTFGPTFRAENSNTSRHLSEFWMVEPEIAFADLAANADLAEDLLRYVFRAVLDERADDMAFFAERIDKDAVRRLEDFVTSSFARMEYTEAIEVLERSGRSFEFPVQWGVALQAEHERYLCEEYARRPVVVVNYPKQIKAFYMRLNDDERTVAAMDVLAPGIGEIVGGSQREERLDVLDARMGELGFDPAAYWWYRDLRRYGTVPHAGFGLGFDRSVAYATGMANIRDVIPFPRTPGSADF
jgi:asparaginyl-tRNA synthetase